MEDSKKKAIIGSIVTVVILALVFFAVRKTTQANVCPKENNAVNLEELVEGDSVTIACARMKKAGYVAIYRENEDGSIVELGRTETLGRGKHKGVTITLSESIYAGEPIAAAIHNESRSWISGGAQESSETEYTEGSTQYDYEGSYVEIGNEDRYILRDRNYEFRDEDDIGTERPQRTSNSSRRNRRNYEFRDDYDDWTDENDYTPNEGGTEGSWVIYDDIRTSFEADRMTDLDGVIQVNPNPPVIAPAPVTGVTPTIQTQITGAIDSSTVTVDAVQGTAITGASVAPDSGTTTTQSATTVE